jgi:hypothetical protein
MSSQRIGRQRLEENHEPSLAPIAPFPGRGGLPCDPLGAGGESRLPAGAALLRFLEGLPLRGPPLRHAEGIVAEGAEQARGLVDAATATRDALLVELVRRRKLREEYSVLWVVTAIGLLVIAFNVKWLLWATALVGAVQPPSTLFFGGLLFVMLLCLMFSVRISRLTYRLRTVSQRLALLEEELHRRGGATPGGRIED